MSGMPWFRMYYEARTDAKLGSLSDAEFRVWFNLLCLAAEGDDERGTVDMSDPFIVAVEVAGGDEELLSRACHALSRLKVIEQRDVTLTFIKFADRQYNKPSDRPEQTAARKRKSRAKPQQPSQKPNVSRDVTPSHAIDTDTDTDKEKKTTAHSRAAKPSSEGIPTFDYIVALCDATGTDVSEISDSVKSKQGAAAKRLRAAGMTPDDVRRCALWLRSQSWRTHGIDLFTVEKERGAWELAGKPDRATKGTTESTDGKPYFDGTQYRRADGLVV